MQHQTIAIDPVGHVVNGRHDTRDAGWGAVVSEIRLAPFARGMGDGLDAFSHALVVFWMQGGGAAVAPLERTLHDVPPRRHPRDDARWPSVGLFAQRARLRPNPIGVTACTIVSVADDAVRVRGLDAIDGTPVLDLKPHVPLFDAPGGVRVPVWQSEVLSGYFADPEPSESGARAAGPAYRIRALRPDDVARVHDLWRRAGLHFRPDGRDAAERLAAELSAAQGLALCAEDTAHPDALAGVVIATSDARKGWINRLAVAPAWRRHGVARALVGRAEEMLFGRGLLIVAAIVDHDNEASYRLFESMGYSPLDAHYLRKSREG